MNTKRRIASIMLYVVAGVALFFGFLYSFSPTLMPYHERALGMAHEQLKPEVAALFLTMMRVIGTSFLSIGVALILLSKAHSAKEINGHGGLSCSWGSYASFPCFS